MAESKKPKGTGRSKAAKTVKQPVPKIVSNPKLIGRSIVRTG